MAAVVGMEVVTTPCLRLSKEYLFLRNEEEGGQACGSSRKTLLVSD